MPNSFSRKAWAPVLVALILTLSTKNQVLGAESLDAVSPVNAAVKYITSLPPSTKIYVWPSRFRIYEILGDVEVISAHVESYKVDRSAILAMTEWDRFVQVSIISLSDDSRSSIVTALQSSRLPSDYRAVVAGVELSGDGCSVYKFIDRDTWSAVGVIIVEHIKLGHSTIAVGACVSTALDYINGLPSPNNYFVYTMFPDAGERRAIMTAIDECSAEGGSDAQESERTRDGRTPLPTPGCVAEKLDQ